MPYWLKGYLNCAYALNDEAMIKEAHFWVEGAFNSQQADGWFGPGEGRKGLATDLVGRDDLWPNMIMLFIFQDYFEKTGDKRVLDLMRKYFKYLEGVPENKFLVGYWPPMRAGDQLYSILWLYNRTGEEWLLDLAHKTHRKAARWDTGTHQPAQREHRPGVPRAGHVLDALRQGRNTWPRRRRSGPTCATSGAGCPAACSVPTRTPATATPVRGR